MVDRKTWPERLGGVLRIREPLPYSMRVALGIVPIAAILGLWFLVTTGSAEERIISPVILPSPVEVVQSFPSLWYEKELSRSVMWSARRVVGGFLVALAIAFPLGVLMGSFSKIRALFEPLAIFGSYMPIPALVPLTMSLFGTREEQKIMFLAIAFVVFLLPMIMRAVAGVDEVYLQTAQSLGASKWEIVRYVLFGVASADIFQAMRMGFGIGWSYIILVEMVAAERGLGQIIIAAQRRGPREHIYLVLLVIVVLAYATDRLWVVAGRRLFPYRESA